MRISFFLLLEENRNKSYKLAIINQQEFPLCLQHLSGAVTFLTGRCFMIHVIYYTRILLCSAIACCRKGCNMHLEGRNLPEDSLTVLLAHSTIAKSRVFTVMREVWQSAPPPSIHPDNQGMHKHSLCPGNTPASVSPAPALTQTPEKEAAFKTAQTLGRNMNFWKQLKKQRYT